jgi:hypothetical protein
VPVTACIIWNARPSRDEEGTVNKNRHPAGGRKVTKVFWQRWAVVLVDSIGRHCELAVLNQRRNFFQLVPMPCEVLAGLLWVWVQDVMHRQDERQDR